MSLYRGPGGAGDATNDAASEATLAIAAANAAEISKNQSQVAANSAADSASAAATSATNAATSATNAANSAAAAVTTLSTSLLKASNLSDLTSASTARTNLGLGTAAVTNSTAYATAAQGAKADTALQSYTETDPVYVASTWYSTTNNSSNWNTAYGWGNHASAGYAADTAVVHKTGDETIGGTKTFSSTITGSISGNAGTVTNGVYTNGSYADPAWITSLAGSKITGTIDGGSF